MITRSHFKSIVLTIASAFLMAFSLKVFIEAGDLFPGGFTGITVIIQRLAKEYLNIAIPFGPLYILLNAYPTILVYKYIGKWFTRYSMIHIVLVSIFVAVIPPLALTYDVFLIAIFGGVLTGVGVSLALIGNASTGGSDFIALYISNKTNQSAWHYIFYGNVTLLIIAGLLFSWEQALYSMIFQFVSTQTINTLHKRYRLMALTMFTAIPEQVIDTILEHSRHGVTKLWGEGGYTKEPRAMVYMVITAYELDEVISLARKADPKIFIDTSYIEKVYGRFYQQPLD
jgi:uncharacterized membrane-anchored protein YitT (DUF2179 family)